AIEHAPPEWDALARERFQRCRRLLSCLGERDGFVPVAATGRGGDGSFLVLAPPEGGSLGARLERGPLAPAQALAVGRAVAHALTRAHRLGATHGDLGARVVWFAPDGRPLVLGLGLGATGEPDPAADVRALAALLVESLGGDARRAGVPRGLARALERALSANASERFADAGAFARALDDIERAPRRGRVLAALALVLI